MQEIIIEFTDLISTIQYHMPLLLGIITVLWMVHILNWLTGYRLNHLGVKPRRMAGLPGIVFSPFLHGDTNHIFLNSIPLFILMSFVILQGLAIFICVLISISLLSGCLTWLLGRPAIHVGASDVIMGLWGYLLMNAFAQGTLLAIALALVCLFYFGSFFLDLVPGEKGVSWEGHLFGFAAGLMTSYICPFLTGIV